MSKHGKLLILLLITAAGAVSVLTAREARLRPARVSAGVRRLLDKARRSCSVPGWIRREWSARMRPARPSGPTVTLIDGSCRSGRPLGSLSDYHIPLAAKDNSLGYIRIRFGAVWYVEDLSNVLGVVPCGTVLWGHEHLKKTRDRSVDGYVVAVRDRKGNTCRGYVSYTVVEVIP